MAMITPTTTVDDGQILWFLNVEVVLGIAMKKIVVGAASLSICLNSLNSKVESITSNTNQISLLTDEVRISAVSILKMQKKIITIMF